MESSRTPTPIPTGTPAAIDAFAALAQDTRLAVFRLLVAQGPGGLPARAIADNLAVAPSTLSFHLAQLERAGLILSRRVHRQIFYAIHIEGVRRLIDFLTEDCCQGNPALCGYGNRKGCHDDHDLPQSEMRHLAERAGHDS